MRGARAKKIRREALKNPHWTRAGWVGGTFINGGVKRTYRALKKAWNNRYLGIGG